MTNSLLCWREFNPKISLSSAPSVSKTSSSSLDPSIYVLAIVDSLVEPDNLVYLTDLSHPDLVRDDPPHLNELMLYASLDKIDDVQDVSFIKEADKFNEFTVTALVSVSNVRFLLLHANSTSTDEQKLKFLSEVYQLYAKVLMDPSYELGAYIRNAKFRAKMTQAKQKFLDSIK
jgi:trafficking protein particle complex subunit 2